MPHVRGQQLSVGIHIALPGQPKKPCATPADGKDFQVFWIVITIAATQKKEGVMCSAGHGRALLLTFSYA